MAKNRLCSIDSCGKKHHSNGYCRNHSRRFLDHGDPLGGKAAPGVPLQWLLDHLNHDNQTDCLTWPFGRTASSDALHAQI